MKDRRPQPIWYFGSIPPGGTLTAIFGLLFPVVRGTIPFQNIRCEKEPHSKVASHRSPAMRFAFVFALVFTAAAALVVCFLIGTAASLSLRLQTVHPVLLSYETGELQPGFSCEETEQLPLLNEGIVFVGSSIFSSWTHLDEQMAPLLVVNCSRNGAVTQDLLDRVDRLVLARHPRIVVYYCGSNDVSLGESAEAILDRTKRFIQILRQKSPNTYFYYVAIQKAPEKGARWKIVDAINREMELYSHSAKSVGYIDLNTVLFDNQGKPREDLFLPDGLHFRPDSTAYWEFSQVLKPVLSTAWESGAGLMQKP
jgi:GDSL-like lipase/acylhydrolase family protein